jgi:hypothetical protein
MYTNNKETIEGFRVGSQTPVDDRLLFRTTAELIDLGASNYKAYRYYEGMIVTVLSDKSRYMWAESSTGAMPSSFSYPTGVEAAGIAYGNRNFNWVEIDSGSAGSGSSGNTFFEQRVEDLVANTPKDLVIIGASVIKNVQILSSTGEDITNGISISILTNTITLEPVVTELF